MTLTRAATCLPPASRIRTSSNPPDPDTEPSVTVPLLLPSTEAIVPSVFTPAPPLSPPSCASPAGLPTLEPALQPTHAKPARAHRIAQVLMPPIAILDIY